MSKWTVLLAIGLFFLWIIYLRMEKDREKNEARDRRDDRTIP